MRWQFGGNFQPVRVICTENWRKCITAISKYLWSEVVTEVVDYLTDDIFVWKVIAALIVLIILIHTMYYKIRWVDEKSSNKENLNKVGFKVQDLELKVNILTYKMQYGTWPLPNHVCKSDRKNELQNIRLTLTNSEDRNSWIKHLLLSSRKIKDYNFANKNLVSSVTNLNGLVDLETKYISSKFQNQIPSIESGDLTDKSSGDNSQSEWERCKRYFSTNKMQITRQENQRHKKSEFSTISENNSLKLNGSTNSIENSTFQELQINKQRKKRSRNLDNHQIRELAESFSGFSENICSVKRLCKNNQLRRDASDQREKSDINCKTKMADEGHLEKLEPLEMEKPTKTENSRESRIEEMSSTNEIQPLTDDTLREDSNLSNSKITFPAKTESRPSSIDKSNLTTTQETLDQVKEKLKTLHDILLTYESSDCEQICSITEDCIKSKDAKSNESNLDTNIKENKINQEIPNCNKSEQFESLDQTSSSSSSVQIDSNLINKSNKIPSNSDHSNRPESSDFESDDDKTEKILETESKISSNTFTKTESKCNLPEEKSESFDRNLNNNRKTMSQMGKDTNYKSEVIPMDTSDDQFSQSSSQTEFSNDEILDNQSSPLQNKNCFSPRGKSKSKVNPEIISKNFETKKIPKESSNENKKLETNNKNISNSEINNENLSKIREANKNIQKIPEINDLDKTNKKNVFQTKFLDILPEEQSASSLTESTSKKSDEEFQNLGENSKTVLSSASSEYFSFVNITHKEKITRTLKPELWENGNDTQTTITKTFENTSRDNKNESEYNATNKQITYLKKETKSGNEKRKLETDKESVKPEEKINQEKNKKEEKSEENIKQKNDKKRGKKERNEEKEVKEEKLKEKCKESSKEPEKNQIEGKNYKLDPEIKRINRNFTSTTDSSSDESIAQFIRELNSDKVKTTQVFRDTKFIMNFAKSSEKLFNIDEAQERESVLSLQRRPGSFSLTENESKQNIFKSLNSDSFSNSKMEITNYQNEFSETKNININKANEKINIPENRSIFDSQFTKKDKIKNESPRGKNPKTDSDKIIIEILTTKKESVEASKRKKIEFNSNQENQGQTENFELNITSDPRLSKPSSNEKSEDNLRIIGKINVEVQQEDDKNNKENQEQTEMMLIDLSDDTSKSVPKTQILENDKINILDEILDEKNIENNCLIPNKSPSIHELKFNNINNNQSESEFSTLTNSQNYSSTSGMSLLEKPNNSQTIKITENTFTQCTSAPLLQNFTPATKTNPTPINLNFEKGFTPEKIQPNSPDSTKSPKHSTKDKLNEKTFKSTGNSTGKQLRTKSYLNLNLKDKSENPIQRRSRSFASPRMIQREFNRESKEINKTVENTIEIEKTRLTSKTSLKSTESQKPSKSCIPILKSRLENIRKEPKPRYRSPTRGPLTINPAPDELDFKVTRYMNDGINAEPNNNEKSFGDNFGPVPELSKEEHPKSDEKTVIYINIMTGHDQSTRKVVNPKKFLEFMKDREMKIDKFASEEKNQDNCPLSNFGQESKKNLPNRFLFHVEQKEREVSVKPSVMDNSTSISDFPQFCNSENRDKNRFKIFDVPEELTKEEYIHLLDLLNQDPNLEQLRKMHSLCSKLGLGFQE